MVRKKNWVEILFGQTKFGSKFLLAGKKSLGQKKIWPTFFLGKIFFAERKNNWVNNKNWVAFFLTEKKCGSKKFCPKKM